MVLPILLILDVAVEKRIQNNDSWKLKYVIPENSRNK